MKRMLALVFLLAGFSWVSFGEEKEQDVYNSLVFKKWLTDSTVNFENLKYTDTHVILVFWSQDKALKSSFPNAPSDSSTKGGSSRGNGCGSGGGENGSERRYSVTDHGATRWVTEGLKKYQHSNVAFLGVFVKGQYLLVIPKYRNAGQIPQIEDFDSISMKKVCGAGKDGSYALINPAGNIMKRYKGVDFMYDTNYVDDIALPGRSKSWFRNPYKDFTDLPRSLEKLQFYLTYGHFAEAYKRIRPYVNTRSDKLKRVVSKSMKMIKNYQDSLLKDIEKCIEQSDIDEAVRKTFQAIKEHNKIKCAFTKKLVAILKEYRKDVGVKKLDKARKLFNTAMKFFKQGKTKEAKMYFKCIKKSFPDNYYGAQSSHILDVM